MSQKGVMTQAQHLELRILTRSTLAIFSGTTEYLTM